MSKSGTKVLDFNLCLQNFVATINPRKGIVSLDEQTISQKLLYGLELKGRMCIPQMLGLESDGGSEEEDYDQLRTNKASKSEPQTLAQQYVKACPTCPFSQVIQFTQRLSLQQLAIEAVEGGQQRPRQVSIEAEMIMMDLKERAIQLRRKLVSSRRAAIQDCESYCDQAGNSRKEENQFYINKGGLNWKLSAPKRIASNNTKIKIGKIKC